MAIAILSNPEIIQPVYSIQEYELYDSANYTNDGFYYKIIVTVGAETRTIKQLKDENNKAVIDIQTILQSFFESNISTETSCINEYAVTTSTDFMKSYIINVYSYWDAGSSGHTPQTKYVFNGVDLYNRTWDASSHMFNDDASCYFLTNWNISRDINVVDDVYLNAIQYTTITGWEKFKGIKLTRYQLDGSVDSSILTNTQASNAAYYYIMNVGPDALNTAFSGITIDSSTDYYIIQDASNYTYPYRVNVVKSDKRFERYYRILYTGGLGATEGFNFNLNPENVIDISKTEYVNDRIKRTFATKASDNYLIRSGWLSNDKSKALKELWHSPKAVLVEPNNVLAPIVINENSKLIKNKRNEGTLFYTFSFTMGDNYEIQQQ